MIRKQIQNRHIKVYTHVHIGSLRGTEIYIFFSDMVRNNFFPTGKVYAMHILLSHFSNSWQEVRNNKPIHVSEIDTTTLAGSSQKASASDRTKRGRKTSKFIGRLESAASRRRPKQRLIKRPSRHPQLTRQTELYEHTS